MTDLATLKATIKRKLRGRTDLDDDIAAAIQDAIKQWEGERFWFNESRFRLNTVDGTEEYAIPSDLLTEAGAALGTGVDLLVVDAVKVIVNNDSYPLLERSEQWLDGWQAPASQYTGTPDYYGIFGNKFRIGPIPDGVYQITISGISKLATLSAGTDTNAWMVEGESLIRHQTLAELYRFPLRDEAGATLAIAGINDALAALNKKTGSKVDRGRIRAWGTV